MKDQEHLKHGFTNPPAHASTSGMTGGGFYNSHSAPQWKAIEVLLPWLVEALQDLPASDPSPFTIADFGCSEGGNSITVIKQLVDAVRQKSDRPIQTIHSDLPTNDFSKLLTGLRPKGSSVFGTNTFSAAVAGSMYDQLLPDRSCHLSMTFNAIGFLSRSPLDTLPGYILPNGPSEARGNGYVSDEDRQVFSDLAREDVATFLKRRAQELVAGGKLLVQVFGTKEEARTCDGIYDLLNDAVLSHVESGDISSDTYARYYQPVYMRSLTELLSPLSDPALGTDVLFRLDRAESYEIEVPFNTHFNETGNLEAYATDYVAFFRAFTEAVLRAALPDTPEKATLVDKIYQTAKELLKNQPDLYPFRYAAVAMLLTRTA